MLAPGTVRQHGVHRIRICVAHSLCSTNDPMCMRLQAQACKLAPLTMHQHGVHCIRICIAQTSCSTYDPCCACINACVCRGVQQGFAIRVYLCAAHITLGCVLMQQARYLMEVGVLAHASFAHTGSALQMCVNRQHRQQAMLMCSSSSGSHHLANQTCCSQWAELQMPVQQAVLRCSGGCGSHHPAPLLFSVRNTEILNGSSP
eukprot:269300-Pelagomonas_calceolata.AAC.11